jgi:hypothetical protein
MITQKGYSNDPGIMPEGIVITFGKKLIELYRGTGNLDKCFRECMAIDEAVWLHRCSTGPKYDIAKVYIIVEGEIDYRVNFGGFQKGEPARFFRDGKLFVMNSPRILLAGPLEDAPSGLMFKGFQGFRYCTQLF